MFWEQDRSAASLDPRPVQAQVREYQQQEQQGQDEVDVTPVMPAQAEQQLGLLGILARLESRGRVRHRSLEAVPI